VVNLVQKLHLLYCSWSVHCKAVYNWSRFNFILLILKTFPCRKILVHDIPIIHFFRHHLISCFHYLSTCKISIQLLHIVCLQFHCTFREGFKSWNNKLSFLKHLSYEILHQCTSVTSARPQLTLDLTVSVFSLRTVDHFSSIEQTSEQLPPRQFILCITSKQTDDVL